MGDKPILWYACGLVSGLVLAFLWDKARVITRQHKTLWAAHVKAQKP